MSVQQPTSDTIEEFLIDRTHDGAYLWVYTLVPVVVTGVVLWLLVLLYGGLMPQRPQQIVVIAAVLCAVFLASRATLRALRRHHVRRSHLVQRARPALQHVEQVIAQGASPSAILDVLRDEIQIALQPTSLEFGLYDPRGDAYAVVGSDLRIPAECPLGAWILRLPTAAPTPLADAAAAHALTDAPQANAMHARGVRILVSLGKQGWVGLGQLPGNAHYRDAQSAFLQALTRPVAAELQRAALAEAQERHAEELQALFWIAQSLNFAMDADTLMELIYTQLHRVIRAPNFYIALKDSAGERLSFAFYIEDNERKYPDYTWASSEGLTGVLIANNMTLRTSDYDEECRRRGLEPAGPRPCHAWMGTALTAGDRSVGVMVVSAFDSNLQFTQAEETFFGTVAAYTAAILERHALYARLESRARQLATLNEIGQLLASSLDLDEVLDLVVRNAADLLESEAGSLLLVDENSGDLVFRVSSGPVGERLIGSRVPAGKGIAGAAFSQNRPIISEDTRQDVRWYSALDSRAEFVTESVLAVPLNARGRTIGALEVVNRRGGRPFDEADGELLLSFGAQAAIAIENARLFTTTDQALQARLQELTTLQIIDRQLNATLDYDAVMDQTLDWALRITGATIGTIAALHEADDGTRGLRFLAHRGYDEADFAHFLSDQLWPLDGGLVGETVVTGRTTLVSPVEEHPRYVEVKPGMQAQLTVPIKREERVIGAIALESTDSDSLSPEHVAFVERLADHAAIAIDNARLFEQLQLADEARAEFVSFVSHELKQPMTSIKGYADLLIKGVSGALNPQQQQFVDVVRNNVTRMDRMVQDLLDISRIESGKLKLELAQVEPADIVDEAVQAFEQEISAKGQRLHTEVAPDLPTVSVDRGRLVQVLTNLISNANKYTPEGGNITVRAEKAGEAGTPCVRWSVTDDGIGMTEEEVAQLFTKYFRSKRAAVRSVQGTGLGLVISRSIIEMHGGRLDVASAYGQGSTFSVTIPSTPPTAVPGT